MAYFPNGTSGYVFDEQCARCRFGEGPCPIWNMQQEFNYKACNIPVARAIMDSLVKDDGTCAMFALAPEVFQKPFDGRGDALELPGIISPVQAIIDQLIAFPTHMPEVEDMTDREKFAVAAASGCKVRVVEGSEPNVLKFETVELVGIVKAGGRYVVYRRERAE